MKYHSITELNVKTMPMVVKSSMYSFNLEKFFKQQYLIRKCRTNIKVLLIYGTHFYIPGILQLKSVYAIQILYVII